MFNTFRLDVSNAAAIHDDRYGEDVAGDPGLPAGGGSEPPIDQADAPQGDEAPPQAAPDADEDDVDFDPTEHDDLPFKDHPRFKALANKNRRLQRNLAKARAVSERVKQLGNLDDLVVAARNYADLQRSAESNPRLRALLNGGEAEPEPRGRRAPAADDFDAKDFPFDMSAPGASWLLQQAKAVHETRQALQQVLGAVQAMQQARQGEQVSRVVSTWREATEAAAAKVPERLNGLPLRQLFRDAVAGAFAFAREKNLKVDPKRVIDHYLKEYKVPTPAAASASDAARQRMAENNRSLPRGAVMAGGGPPAAAGRRRETVLDVGRRLRSSLS